VAQGKVRDDETEGSKTGSFLKRFYNYFQKENKLIKRLIRVIRRDIQWNFYKSNFKGNKKIFEL
jgi:hypothetical protein